MTPPDQCGAVQRKGGTIQWICKAPRGHPSHPHPNDTNGTGHWYINAAALDHQDRP